MSLRTKLLVGLGLPTLITFLILIGLNYRAASNDALTEVSRFVTQLGARKAAEVSGQFAVMEPAPQMLAEILGSTQPKTDEEVFSWLELSIAINPYAFGSAAGYEKGAFDPARPLFCPYVTKGGDRTYLDPNHGTYDYTADEAVTPWYVIPRRTGKPYWTDPFYDINTWMCCYAVPFFRDGRFAGVATVDIATTGVNQILKDGQVDLDGFAPGGYFFMINPNGAITGHPDEKLIHEGVNLIDLNLAVAGDDELKEPWSELKELMAKEESFTLRLRNTLDDQGRSWKWVGFNRVDATGWYLAVVVDEKAALAPAKTKLVKDVGIIVLLMVILVLAMLVPVSRLIRQLSAMAEALKSQFQRLDLAYRHIEASSRNLGEVASRQSEQVDVSNEVLNRLKDISQANHDNARQGLDIGRRTSDQIQGGSEAVMRMGQAMESIAEASTRIQSILKTIEDIAFQTNLLALNAAVEAARAGEAGSGFAVVADEVRNLAQRSAEAVRNTDELIAVTLERIKNGELISADLEASFQTISESGQSTIEAIRRIAESIDDNSGQMEQLGRSSADLNSAAGETAEAAGAISSEALELGRQAQELNMVISGLENLIDHGRSQIMVRPPLTPGPERRLIM